MRRWAVGAFVAAGLLVRGAGARADDGAPESSASVAETSPAPATRTGASVERHASPSRRWYGWQTLLVDGAMIAAFTSGVGRDARPLAWTGLAGYFLAAPFVHAANGRPRVMAADIGMRLVAPMLTTLGGFAIGTLACRRGTCSGVGAAVGLLAAWPVAATIDASVLAVDDGEPAPAPDNPPPAPAVGLSVGPTVAEGGVRGASLTANGRF